MAPAGDTVPALPPEAGPVWRARAARLGLAAVVIIFATAAVHTRRGGPARGPASSRGAPGAEATPAFACGHEAVAAGVIARLAVPVVKEGHRPGPGPSSSPGNHGASSNAHAHTHAHADASTDHAEARVTPPMLARSIYGTVAMRDVRSILILGGSVTMGHGVGAENSWAAQVAAALAPGGWASQNQKSGNMFQVGVFLGFVTRPGTTRAEGPREAHVRRAKRNQPDRRLTDYFTALFFFRSASSTRAR